MIDIKNIHFSTVIMQLVTKPPVRHILSERPAAFVCTNSTLLSQSTHSTPVLGLTLKPFQIEKRFSAYLIIFRLDSSFELICIIFYPGTLDTIGSGES
jgi:hypothetical protein